MDTVQDYKCVHCTEMYTSAQEWLDHCRRDHGDRDLKVFVRHVSFSERALSRRPMFVLKNFHMKVRDLEGKRSRIDDGDLTLRTTSDGGEESGGDSSFAGERTDANRLPGVGNSSSLGTGTSRPRLATTGKSRSMDSTRVAGGRQEHGLISSPWWQQRPAYTTSAANDTGTLPNIHRGMGSLTVTLSKSLSSLAENEISLPAAKWDSDESINSDDKVPLCEEADVSDLMDISTLRIREDESSQKSTRDRPQAHSEVHHAPAINSTSGSALQELARSATNSANSDVTSQQRQSARSTSSPYLRSGAGLGGANKQQTAADPIASCPDSFSLRDPRPLEDGKSTAHTNGFVFTDDSEQKKHDFTTAHHGNANNKQNTSTTDEDIIKFGDGLGQAVTTADGTNNASYYHDSATCTARSNDKVKQWIDTSQFTDNIPDPSIHDNNHVQKQRDRYLLNLDHPDLQNFDRNMGNNSSSGSADNGKTGTTRKQPKLRTGSRTVHGVRDLGKVNNRYSTGAILDIARSGAQWVIPNPQPAGSSSKRKTLARQRHTHDDISIAKMSQILPVDAFRKLCKTNSLDETLKAFDELQFSVGLRPNDRSNYYNQIKNKVECSEAAKFFRLLDARLKNEEYGGGKICQKATILVIGGGPCGLRTAIECALLGARVVVLEMRSYATRNNVLHLWPNAAADIKAIGAKVFYPKFCAGAIHHVSIRRLQLILMKIALILGVEIHTPVTFEELLPPNPEKGTSWRVRASPASCPVNNLEFQVVVGADGKRNALDFSRKFTRGKVSIAITANFKNPNTGLHSRVSEIPGVISVKRPELFSELKKKTGLEFENFVYFRDETHYFITTAKKKSIVDQGIVKKETADLRAMFQPDNINHDKLLASVRTIAQTCWRVDNPSFTSLPELDFVLDRYGQEDVQIFDFAALHQAEHACMVKERHGHKLLLCIVGDTLLEPFWPTGSGIAKGFLGCLDAAWTIRNWVSHKLSDLDAIAERESIFRVLPQVTPTSLLKDKCTIDPKTRYGTMFGVRVPLNQVKAKDVQHLYNTTDAVKRKGCGITFQDVPMEKRRLYRGGSIDTHRLVGWYKDKLSRYNHLVKVTDLAKSWNNGLAFCALIQCERPDLLNIESLDKNDCKGNIQQAFNIIEQEFGVEQMMSPDDLAGNDEPDRLTMMSYLFHIYEYFVTKDDTKEPTIRGSQKGGGTVAEAGLARRPSAYSLLHTIANQAVLLRTLERDAKRVRDLDVNRLARQSSITGQTPGIDYFLKTASLDRRAKNKVHMAIRRTKTIKPEEAAKTWRRKAQERKQRRKAAYMNVSARGDESKENTVPVETRAKQRRTIETMDFVKSRNKAENDKEPDGNSIRKGVKFSEDAKMDDGPSEPMNAEDEETTRRMMSLPRQACGGVASKAIQAFRDLENRQNQNDGPHSPDCVDSPDNAPPQEKNRTPLKRRTAVRNNSRSSADDKSPGVNTMKRTGEICCLCNKKLYLVERFSAQGHFLHRQCFKCNTCGTHLRVGNYVKVEDKQGEPKFYCTAHAFQAGALDVNWKGESNDSGEAADDDTLKASDQGIDQDYCGPLTEDELRYVDDGNNDEDDGSTTEEEDDDDIGISFDQTYAANLPPDGDRYSTLTLTSILADLESKALGHGAAEELDDLRSNATDTSSQLLQQEVIQQGLEDVQAERDQLEEDGVQLEKQIRGESGDRLSKCDDDLMNAWLETARKKQELNEKESKLMLQLRLMGLQERLRAMLEMMPLVNEAETSAIEEKVEWMEAATARMEKAAIKEDLSEMMEHMIHMKDFFGKTQC